MPLGELGVDINRPVGISRKQQEASKDYVRVVKKLKVAHNAGQEQGEDKENATGAFAADMKVLNEDGNLKRASVKNEGFHGFVGMRMEDDEIEGSPKKKVRQPIIEQHTHAEGRGGDKEEVVEMGFKKATEALSPSDEREYDSEDPLDETETGEAQEPRGEREKSDSVEPVDEALEDQRQTTTLPVGVDMAAQGRPAFDAEISSDELRSSSPPTILAENVMVDELEARESSTPTKTKTAIESQCHESPESREPSQDSTTQAALPRRISDDDTAFLRAFMSRTKATKAERAAQDETPHSTTRDGDGATGMDAEQERPATKNSDHLTPTVRLEPSDQEDQEDAVPTSPLRRSKRAVVTSIPRPQILPNAIQLKRANGNEFIFKSNQASSTANVAMTTRSNTKKNKGTAINVPARLEEILAEKAKEHSAEHEPSADASKATLETSNDKATKKRKRDKYDTGSKAKKVLRWNDENLVSYQEAEQSLDSEDIEDSVQESAREKDEENHEPNKHVKLALTLGHGSSETVSTEEDKATEPAKETAQPRKDEQKVRRVRRGIVGSVNGTPAPKTRSKSIIENDEMDDVAGEEGPQARVSDAATATVGALAPEAPPKSTSRTAPVAAAAAGTTRKSRMPVPLTARRGAPASVSVKHDGSSLPARATASVSRGTKRSKEGGNGMPAAEQEGEKEGAKADLLGKRRLRVRS